MSHLDVAKRNSQANVRHSKTKSSLGRNKSRKKVRMTIQPNQNGEYPIQPFVPTNFDFLNAEMFNKVSLQINEKRDRIMLEFVETEQNYVKDLLIIKNVFKTPVEMAIFESAIPLVDEDVASIFSNLDELIGVNQRLLVEMIEKIKSWSTSTCIGKILKDLVYFLKMYTTYSINYNDAIYSLAEVEQKKAFLDLINAIQALPVCNGLNLKAFLIKPIQRIPRYRLLFEDFITNTEENHPDKKTLTEALEVLKVVADEVNSAITKQEDAEKLIEISKKLIFEKDFMLLNGGRSFLYEGELTKICRKERKKRQFYLFSDLLIYAIPQGSKYKVSNILELNRTRVTDIKDNKIRNITNSIQIENDAKSFIVYAATPEEKAIWFQQLTNSIKKFNKNIETLKKENKNSNIAPVWVPDSQAKTCSICAIKFTLTNRRHHCRQCGNVVCGDCSKQNKELPNLGMVRVCDDCFNKAVTLTEKVIFDESSEGEDYKQEMAIALFDYTAPPSTPDAPKLSFKKGDMITIVEKHTSGWWLGCLEDQHGWVPSAYLKIETAENNEGTR